MKTSEFGSIMRTNSQTNKISFEIYGKIWYSGQSAFGTLSHKPCLIVDKFPLNAMFAFKV